MWRSKGDPLSRGTSRSCSSPIPVRPPDFYVGFSIGLFRKAIRLPSSGQVIPFIFSVGAIVALLWRFYRPETEDERLETAQSICETFCQLDDAKVLAKVLKTLPVRDLNLLQEAQCVLLSEVFMQEPNRGLLQNWRSMMTVRENRWDSARISYS